MKNLTTPQIENLKAELESMKARHSENTEYRMENYYNCVDDYSWGGLCDQAQSQAERQLSLTIDILIRQHENGGYLTETVTEYELQLLDGTFVSSNIVNGKFGSCFMWRNENDGANFCGLSKKQSTFNKKGFQVITKIYQFNVVYRGKTSKNGNQLCNVELISLTESIDEKLDTSIMNNSFLMFQYNNK